MIHTESRSRPYFLSELAMLYYELLDGSARDFFCVSDRKLFYLQFRKGVSASTEIFLKPRNWIVAKSGLSHMVPMGIAPAGVLNRQPMQQKIGPRWSGKLLMHSAAPD
jgi:hypothetical protein